MSKDKTHHRDPVDQLAHPVDALGSEAGGLGQQAPIFDKDHGIKPPAHRQLDDAEHVLKAPYPRVNPPNPPDSGRHGGTEPRVKNPAELNPVSRCGVVEFTDMRGHVWPAIVLAVKDDGSTVDLMLLTNRGATPDFDIPQSKVPAGEEKAHGRWSWPPRS